MSRKRLKKAAGPAAPKHSHVEKFTTEQILENVRPTPMFSNHLSDEEKVIKIAEKYAEIMTILGLDLKNDSLKGTPRRIAKMYVQELFSGLSADYFPRITAIENEMQYDQMVAIQDIQVLSVCEHHFQTIDGLATVAYIPSGKVIGISKINRIVQFFSRRPQVQERLTKQIADCLQFVLDTQHVAVHITAKHYCVIARGVQDASSVTTTTDLRGDFKDRQDTRMEFMQHCTTSLR